MVGRLFLPFPPTSWNDCGIEGSSSLFVSLPASGGCKWWVGACVPPIASEATPTHACHPRNALDYCTLDYCMAGHHLVTLARTNQSNEHQLKLFNVVDQCWNSLRHQKKTPPRISDVTNFPTFFAASSLLPKSPACAPLFDVKFQLSGQRHFYLKVLNTCVHKGQ